MGHPNLSDFQGNCHLPVCSQRIKPGYHTQMKSILNVRLSETTGRPRNVSVLELPGNVLIVPQATLGGKMKGRSVQYHSNISKDEGRVFYEKFITLCEETVQANSTNLPDSPPKKVKHGTYGNRQVLSVETNGPFTHVFDF